MAYAIVQGLMAFFLFYVLLFGLYQSEKTTTNLVQTWAFTQASERFEAFAEYFFAPCDTCPSVLPHRPWPSA